MRQLLHRVVEVLRDFAWGIDAGNAIRHGAPVPAPRRARPDRDRDGDQPAGRIAGHTRARPLYWAVDDRGGLRLAGETLPGTGPEPVTH